MVVVAADAVVMAAAVVVVVVVVEMMILVVALVMIVEMMAVLVAVVAAVVVVVVVAAAHPGIELGHELPTLQSSSIGKSGSPSAAGVYTTCNPVTLFWFVPVSSAAVAADLTCVRIRAFCVAESV